MIDVLVTGCNGYIGSHLVGKLFAKKCNVYGLDFKEGNKVEHYTKKTWKNDINKPNDWEKDIFAKKWDAICHLAALVSVGESVKIPSDYYQTNWQGTLNLLKKLHYKHFIFASTGAANNPNSPYGFSKRIAEDTIIEIAKNYSIFRFYNVVGEGEFSMTNEDGLFMQLKKSQKTGIFTIFGGDYPNTKDGTPVRDYIHVEDIVGAISNCVLSTPANTPFECLGYGMSTTVQEFADTFKKINNASFSIKIGERRKGDLEISEVPFVSKYMEQNYSLENLVKC